MPAQTATVDPKFERIKGSDYEISSRDRSAVGRTPRWRQWPSTLADDAAHEGDLLTGERLTCSGE
jgi:hypothetical protein